MSISIESANQPCKYDHDNHHWDREDEPAAKRAIVSRTWRQPGGPPRVKMRISFGLQ
jgi:hypothetical protein